MKKNTTKETPVKKAATKKTTTKKTTAKKSTRAKKEEPVEVEIDDELLEGLEWEDIDVDDLVIDDEAPFSGTILDAVEILADKSEDSQLSEEFGVEMESILDFLIPLSDLSPVQWVLVSILASHDDSLTMRELGVHLGLSNLRMHKYQSELEDLVQVKRWVCVKQHGLGRNRKVYSLYPNVMEALAKSEVYVAENLGNMELGDFIRCMANHYTVRFSDSDKDDVYDVDWTRYLIRQNPQLKLCQVAMGVKKKLYSDILLMALLYDYAMCGEDDNVGLNIGALRRGVLPPGVAYEVCESLTAGEHELMKKGWVEHKCEDGMADCNTYVLTQKFKKELLAGWSPFVGMVRKPKTMASSCNMLKWDTIAEKKLYYNPEVQQKVDRLHRIFEGDRLEDIQKQLKAEDMRTGMAILLEGGPGTGKTELVRQLAHRSQRDLVMVDLSGVKSKYVGESEENVAEIFKRYKQLCRSEERCPILFVNECDGLLGKRSANPERAVDKMENAVQNLLLQALEDQEGVIICTTNLAASLDKAFERRFLERIRVDAPNAEVRASILHSMLPKLPMEDTIKLSQTYALSGGQMENVTRKVLIENILEGTTLTLSQVERYCQEESHDLKKSKPRTRIGF